MVWLTGTFKAFVNKYFEKVLTQFLWKYKWLSNKLIALFLSHKKFLKVFHKRIPLKYPLTKSIRKGYQ